MKKIYVVTKYVVASSVEDALEKEKDYKVDDCWAEQDTHKEYLRDRVGLTNKIGFTKNE